VDGSKVQVYEGFGTQVSLSEHVSIYGRVWVSPINVGLKRVLFEIKGSRWETVGALFAYGWRGLQALLVVEFGGHWLLRLLAVGGWWMFRVMGIGVGLV